MQHKTDKVKESLTNMGDRMRKSNKHVIVISEKQNRKEISEESISNQERKRTV